MPCCRGQDYDQMFDAKTAKKQLRRYEKRGAEGQTKNLLNSLKKALKSAGSDEFTHLDIGGGVGVLQHELQASGATRTTAVDASAPYLSLLCAAAKERGYEGNQICVEGDFTAVAPELEQSTVVTLDKVICCYPDMPGLVRASAKKATLFYGIVLPRDTAIFRAGAKAVNWFVRHLLRWKFQAFVHSQMEIDQLIEDEGLRLVDEVPGFVMCVRVYQRG